MGSDPAAEHAPDPDEAPCHAVDVPAFRLGRTPVTNAQYGAFVHVTGHRPSAAWPSADRMPSAMPPAGPVLAPAGR